MANQNDIPEDNERKRNEPIPDSIRWFREHSVPITGVVVVFLVVCLVGPTSRIDWTKAKDFTDVFRNVTQSLAFIAGGIWAYFKFVKARTFQESLIPVVSGKFVAIEDRVYLVATIQVKNVGLSKIEFSQKGSALMVFEYAPTSLEKIQTVEGKQVTAFDLFEPRSFYRAKRKNSGTNTNSTTRFSRSGLPTGTRNIFTF